MVKVKNKVIFIAKSKGAMDKEFIKSTELQGRLRKKITRVQKLKIASPIEVLITGSYKEYKIELKPKDTKHASKILGMLKIAEK